MDTDKPREGKSKKFFKEKGSTMNLRKIRKITHKKRQLLDKNGNAASNKKKLKRKRFLKKRKMLKKLQAKTKRDAAGTGSKDQGPAVAKEETKQNNKSPVNEESDQMVEGDNSHEENSVTEKPEYSASESNTMTLEQFTDIVLASEGMISKEAKENNNNVEVVKREPETVESETRPKSPEAAKNKEHSAMVATILQNKDLTVEVKKTGKSKPVVLTPRQPLYAKQAAKNATAPSSSSTSGNSVVVSVKPRVANTPVTLPPSGGLPSVPRLVEEWLKKMPAGEKSQKATENAAQITSVSPDSALNLSTKSTTRCSSGHASPAGSQTGNNGSNVLKLEERVTPVVTISPKGSSQQYYPNQFAPKPKQVAAPSSKPFEIKKAIVASTSPQATSVPTAAASNIYPGFKKMVIGRALPFEGDSHREEVKSRAIRDIQLAHTKDVHGNYPIHMSVLMRKPCLVRRYCCVLQVLDSSLDILNDDKLTPLHLAVRDNSMEIIELLLAFGADPLARDFRGNSSIHMATAVGSTECLKLLAENVRCKEDLNQQNNFGIAPLHIALMNGDKSCTEILLRFGADPKAIEQLSPKAAQHSVKRESKGDTSDIPKKKPRLYAH